jgi:hypothetical protein
MAKKKKFLPKEAVDVQNSLRTLNLGEMEYDLKPFIKDRKVVKIELKAKTNEAKMAVKDGDIGKQLRRTEKTLLDIEKKNEETLVLRYVPKGRPGRKAKDAADKASPKKPLNAHKKGAAKKPRSIKKLRKKLPHGSGSKPHVRGFNGMLERLSKKERAECLATVTAPSHNTDLAKVLSGYIIVKGPVSKLSPDMKMVVQMLKNHGLVVPLKTLLKKL